MATKLYFHASTSVPAGTMPTDEQSSLAAFDNFEANDDTNRLMNKKIGTSQTSLANSSDASTSTRNYYIARWVSPLLNQTSVAANTWTYNFAAQESNTNANFTVSGTAQPIRVNCYVWKPSNGTKYGTILDGNTANEYNEAGTGETAHHGTFSGAAVSSLTAGDAVIVFEAWAVVTQAMAVSYTQTYYFDGTTENTTEGASVSNHASYLETPENLVFAYSIVVPTQTVSVSDSVARLAAKNRALSTQTVTVSESVARIKGAIRKAGIGHSISLDGTNDQVNCGNHSDLWSQSLTKFSFSCWIYPTIQDATSREVVNHGTFVAHSFRLEIDSTAGRIKFGIRDAVNVGFTALSTALVLNRWNHIICTYDNSLGSANIKIFVDNVQGGTTANLTESINLSATLSLASVSTDFAGQIKDYRWWTTIALDSTQRTNVFNNSSSAPTPNYWLKMREGTGTPVDAILGKTTGLDNGATWHKNCPDIWVYEEVLSTEQLARQAAKNRALPTETVIVGETLTRMTAKNRALATQTVTVADDVDIEVGVATNDVHRTLEETVVIGESLTRQASKNRSLATETVSTGETLTRTAAKNRAIPTETVVVGDSATRLKTANRSLPTETVTVTGGTLARQCNKIRALATETVTVTGGTLARLCNKIRTLVENVVIADDVQRQISGANNVQRSLTENVAVSDSVARQAAKNRALPTETTNITDDVQKSKGSIKSLSETVNISDSIVRQCNKIRTLIENIIISETLTLVNSNIVVPVVLTFSGAGAGGRRLKRLLRRNFRLKRYDFKL